MQDNEVVILAEKVKGSELPQCVHLMSQRINNPRDFHATLAVGEDCIVCISLISRNTPYIDTGPLHIF